MPLSAMWEKHKKFLTVVVSGSAVFLLLVFFADSYRGEAARVESRNRQKATQLENQMNELDFSYYNTIKRADSGEERLTNLLDKVVISKAPGVSDPKGNAADPDIDFRKRKEAIWNSSGERAKRINLSFPASGDVDFDLSGDLTEQEWRDRYLQLTVLDWVFEAAVDLGIRGIEELSPEGVETEVIPGTKKDVLVRYPITAVWQMTFDQVLQLIARFQRDGKYLGVEVIELRREANDPVGILRAELRFVGLDVGEAREDSKRGNQRRRSTRGNRRSRR